MKNRLTGVVAALLTLLAVAVLTAAPAEAQISLTLDEPFITVVRPTTGTQQFPVNGTVTTDPQVDATFFGASAAFRLEGNFLQFGFDGDYAQYVFADLSGVDYTGRIIVVEISSSTPPGDYFFNANGDPTGTQIEGINLATQEPVVSITNWGVRVIDGSAAAAPEPSAVMLLLPVFLGVAALRRRGKWSRPASNYNTNTLTTKRKRLL